MTVPTAIEIRAQQAALRDVVATNDLPHLQAIVAAFEHPAIFNLATICAQAQPLMADERSVKMIDGLVRVLNATLKGLTATRNAAALIVGQEPPVEEQPVE